MSERDPVANAVRLLRWMAESPNDTFGVREIGRGLKMQPSTVSRVLAKLAGERLVSRNARTGEYSLGLEVLRLGQLASQKLDIRKVARPHIEAVVAASNESTLLALYDPTRREMLRVDPVYSTHPLSYTAQLDTWTEIYRGASGLGILAFLPPEEISAVLDEADRAADDSSPWLRKTELCAELEHIRARGYAITHGRRLAGAVAVSAPIFGHQPSTVLGDVVTHIPETRWHADMETEIATLVIDAARSITRDLGGQPPRRPGTVRQ